MDKYETAHRLTQARDRVQLQNADPKTSLAAGNLVASALEQQLHGRGEVRMSPDPRVNQAANDMLDRMRDLNGIGGLGADERRLVRGAREVLSRLQAPK